MSAPRKVQELNAYLVPVHGGKVLLLKRRKTEFWEFPGGKVEWGEEPSVSAKRELKEETGLECASPSFLGITSATYEKDGGQKHSVYLVYKGEVGGEDVSLGLEHEDFRWVSLEELRFMKLGLNCEDVPGML
jgi:8-oxo-dGTP diphosphatase